MRSRPMSSMKDGGSFARNSAILIARGAVAGALVGLLDACDAVAGGFAAALPPATAVAAVVVMSCLGAAAGTLIAAACAVPATVVRSRYRTAAWLQPHRLQASLAAALAIVTGGLAWGFRMLLVVPPSYVVGAAAAAGLVAAAAALRYRARPAISVVLWLVLFGWSYLIGARLLYSFSRHGAATYAHAGWAVGLCVLATVALSTAPQAWTPRWRLERLIAPAIIAAVAVLGFGRTILVHTPHALRLLLYERTSFTYRLLATLPHRESTLHELAQSCPAVSPAAATKTPPLDDLPEIRGVVMIMVDALRGDRVPSAHAPRMTALAAESYRFANAYTTSPVTRRAAGAMMTGMSSARVRTSAQPTPLLGHTLSAAHIRTVALSSHRYLKPWVGNFDIYEDLAPEKTKANRETLGSKVTFERASYHLDQLGETTRFFLLVHFYDPHAHYVTNPMFPAGQSLESRYDAEVAYTDHYVGRLLDHLKQRGHARDVAVILVGDHGEEHWEHRYRWHRARVYDESVRVPLLLRVPGVTGGTTIDDLVSVMDLSPTVLELLGLPSIPAHEGISLLSTAHRDPAGRERALVIASDIYPSYALVHRGHKVIANLHTGVLEHYDLTRDPSEQHNLADRALPLFNEMRCQLAHRLPLAAPTEPR